MNLNSQIYGDIFEPNLFSSISGQLESKQALVPVPQVTEAKSTLLVYRFRFVIGFNTPCPPS